jgi:hypothetical protein
MKTKRIVVNPNVLIALGYPAIYEIRNRHEQVVATADLFDDAVYAAEKYHPAMIVRVATGEVVLLPTTNGIASVAKAWLDADEDDHR